MFAKYRKETGRKYRSLASRPAPIAGVRSTTTVREPATRDVPRLNHVAIDSAIVSAVPAPLLSGYSKLTWTKPSLRWKPLPIAGLSGVAGTMKNSAYGSPFGGIVKGAFS